MSKIDTKTMPAVTLRNGASVISDLEKKHAAAERDLAGASAAMKEASAKYQAALGEGREAAIAARRVCTDAEVDVDIASRAVDTLARMVAEASEAFRLAEVEHKLAEAERLRAAFEETTRQQLALMGVGARAIIRAWATAEIAIGEARAALGEGGAEIPAAEDFRRVPRVDRSEVKREKIVRWLRKGLEPLSDEIHKHITGSGKEGHLKFPNERSGSIVTDRAQFERITYRKAEQSIYIAPLVATISIPAISGGLVPGWTPHEHMGPHAALALLEQLELAPVQKKPEFETVDVFEHRVS